MQIDRSNYEICFIDWLDGNLSDLQVEQLKLFLCENPDLREDFDGLITVNLKHPENSYLDKEHLKKSAADLPDSQFEYLCVGHLENDLSAGQQAELKEIIELYPEKKRLYELIHNMRLSPPVITYKHKNKLIIKTPAQIIIRLSVIGLSVAATIALFIMTYFLIPRNLSDKTINTAHNSLIDSSIFNLSVDNTHVQISTDKKPDSTKPKTDKLLAGVEKIPSMITETPENGILKNDSSVRNTYYRESNLNKIPVNAEINLKRVIISNTLVASNTHFIVTPYDDRSKISKFIAKNFREKILKEKTSKDSPLKGYEIAEAGVTGLNKLLGWEMALDKNNDENGELKSVYFSSKILKFNTQIKKADPLP